MAQEFQFVCDGCGAVVHGKFKAAFVHRDYIQVKGTMVLQLMDTRTRYKEFIYLTRPPSEDLTFCLKPGVPCMWDYIKNKQDQYNFRKRTQLQERAGREYGDRIETGGAIKAKPLPYAPDDPSFVVGTKKPKKFGT